MLIFVTLVNRGINAQSFDTIKTQWPYNTTNPNHIANSAEFLYTVAYQYFSVAAKGKSNVYLFIFSLTVISISH